LAIIVISVVPIGIGWLVEKKKGKKKSWEPLRRE
jgi:hypothetical protein